MDPSTSKMRRSKDVCVCGNRRRNITWIKCDYCGQWLHLTCAKLAKPDISNIVKYACECCVKSCGAITSWRCQECAGCVRTSDCGHCSGCQREEDCEKRACTAAVVHHSKQDDAVENMGRRRPVTRSRSRTLKTATTATTSQLPPLTSVVPQRPAPVCLEAPKSKKTTFVMQDSRSSSSESPLTEQNGSVPRTPIPQVIRAPEIYNPKTMLHPAHCKACVLPKKVSSVAVVEIGEKCRRPACQSKKKANSEYCSGGCWAKDNFRLKVPPIDIDLDPVFAIRDKCRLYGCPNHRLVNSECCSIDCMFLVSPGTPKPIPDHLAKLQPAETLPAKHITQVPPPKSFTIIGADAAYFKPVPDDYVPVAQDFIFPPDPVECLSAGSIPTESVDEAISVEPQVTQVSPKNLTPQSRLFRPPKNSFTLPTFVSSTPKPPKIPSIMPSGNGKAKCFNLLCKKERYRQSRYCSEECLAASCEEIMRAYPHLFFDPLRNPR